MSGRPFFEQETGDRIVAALKQGEIVAHARLTRTARRAGEQLELLQPVIFGPSGRGLFAGKFTAVAARTMMVVLADERRAVTMPILDQPDLIDRGIMLAQKMRAFLAERGISVRSAGVTTTRTFLSEYGGKRGAKAKPVAPLAPQNTIGALFAAMANDEVRRTLANAREVVACGLCPALIALIGPGAKPGTSAACWPLLLPLAPYVDAALLDAVEAKRRA
jgi:hypothetical protein